MNDTLRVAILVLAVCTLASAKPLAEQTRAKLNNDIRYLVGQHAGHGQFAVAVVDSEGLVSSVNGKKPYPLASVFKLPLLIALISGQEKGSFPSPRTNLTVGISDQCIGSGRLAKQGVGAPVTVDKACRLMMSVSDNTATDLLFRKLGTQKLDSILTSWGYKGSEILLTNRQAWLLSLGKVPGWGRSTPRQRVERWSALSRSRKLAKAQKIEAAAGGMSLREFQRIEDASTGTQSAAEDRMLAAALDNKMSAEGLARLLVDLDRGKLLSKAGTDRAFDILDGQKYHTRLPRKLSPGTGIYHKTGTLSGVRNDAGILFPVKNQPGVAVVFLSQHVKSGSNGIVDRLAGDVAKLVERAYR